MKSSRISKYLENHTTHFFSLLQSIVIPKWFLMNKLFSVICLPYTLKPTLLKAMKYPKVVWVLTKSLACKYLGKKLKTVVLPWVVSLRIQYLWSLIFLAPFYNIIYYNILSFRALTWKFSKFQPCSWWLADQVSTNGNGWEGAVNCANKWITAERSFSMYLISFYTLASTQVW